MTVSQRSLITDTTAATSSSSLLFCFRKCLPFRHRLILKPRSRRRFRTGTFLALKTRRSSTRSMNRSGTPSSGTCPGLARTSSSSSSPSRTGTSRVQHCETGTFGGRWCDIEAKNAARPTGILCYSPSDAVLLQAFTLTLAITLSLGSHQASSVFSVSTLSFDLPDTSLGVHWSLVQAEFIFAVRNLS